MRKGADSVGWRLQPPLSKLHLLSLIYVVIGCLCADRVGWLFHRPHPSEFPHCADGAGLSVTNLLRYHETRKIAGWAHNIVIPGINIHTFTEARANAASI